MVSPFVSPCSSPRRSNKQSKNPYSSRGLDKFSALLAELEEKRQKVYSKLDSKEAPLVRFVYTSSGECVPVVIKPSKALGRPARKAVHQDAKIKPSKGSPEREAKAKPTETEHDGKTETSMPCRLSVDLQRMKRPSHYYLPVTVIFVLVFLAFFGRSVAIMCTCIAWYLVPTMSEQSRAAVKKKRFARKTSIESRGSFNPRTQKDQKTPCLAAAPARTA